MRWITLSSKMMQQHKVKPNYISMKFSWKVKQVPVPCSKYLLELLIILLTIDFNGVWIIVEVVWLKWYTWLHDCKVIETQKITVSWDTVYILTPKLHIKFSELLHAEKSPKDARFVPSSKNGIRQENI